MNVLRMSPMLAPLRLSAKLDPPACALHHPDRVSRDAGRCASEAEVISVAAQGSGSRRRSMRNPLTSQAPGLLEALGEDPEAMRRRKSRSIRLRVEQDGGFLGHGRTFRRAGKPFTTGAPRDRGSAPPPPPAPQPEVDTAADGGAGDATVIAHDARRRRRRTSTPARAVRTAAAHRIARARDQRVRRSSCRAATSGAVWFVRGP
jgi:hypothetical protein